jgi:hypothetical protein
VRLSRVWRAVSPAVVLLAMSAVPAGAHQGNPDFRSVVRSVTPSVPGLQVQVLGFDSELQLTNRTGRAVVIYGYDGEPYARVLTDGTVQTNVRSPAVYLNEDRFGTTPVPASAKPSLPPQWRTLDRTGRFVWHDHRMHWMAHTTPPIVHDTSKKTKVFDYTIPLQVGAGRGAVGGTLYWVGSASGFPVAAIVSLVVVVLLAVGLVVVVRRRRGGGARPAGGDGSPPAKEAW